MTICYYDNVHYIYILPTWGAAYFMEDASLKSMSVWHFFCPKAKLKFIMLRWATNVLQGVFKAIDDTTEKAGSEFGKPLA